MSAHKKASTKDLFDVFESLEGASSGFEAMMLAGAVVGPLLDSVLAVSARPGAGGQWAIHVFEQGRLREDDPQRPLVLDPEKVWRRLVSKEMVKWSAPRPRDGIGGPAGFHWLGRVVAADTRRFGFLLAGRPQVEFSAEQHAVLRLLAERLLIATRNRRFQAEIGRLTELEQQNQLILSSAGEGIYGLDTEGMTTFVNPAAAEMLGFHVAGLTGQPMHKLLHHSHPDGSDYPREECPICAAFKDGEIHSVDDEVFWRRDGTSFPVEYTSTPIRRGGELCGAVVVFRNLSKLKQSEEALRKALLEVEELKDRLQAENTYLQEEIWGENQFGEIIGESSAIQRVIGAITTVAPIDVSVLITGETGTGKELVARAIHSSGRRRQKSLIKVNCAAIPRDLFESEFFGHVRGAFTGALADRAGRFELADGGTLFLDEIGEIPLEMQSKLLRVLQEGQFERVGDERTRTADVRLIAATNRNLKAEMDAGRFREDLYYRLNVFPLEVPPLRERLADVPLLAAHFVQQAGPRLNRPGVRLSQANAVDLMGYDWPGNVRELRNVVERALIISHSGRLVFDMGPLPALAGSAAGPDRMSDSDRGVKTDPQIKRLEADNLRAALDATGWKIYGLGGAAELLEMKPTTLASRIKKLGLEKEDLPDSKF